MSQARSGTSFRSANGAVLQVPKGIALPPARLPLFHRWRMRKQWRYVAVWSARLSLSACRIRVGPAFQEFWALWDGQTLRQRTRKWPGLLDLGDGRLAFHDRDVAVELTLRKRDAFQVLTLDERAYTWTGKDLVQATGSIRIGDVNHPIDAPGLVDDSAGYHPRHSRYKWSAGAGTDVQGRAVAWNLVEGINDLPTSSERTLWIDAVPTELGQVHIGDDLAGVDFAEGGRLSFTAEAARETSDNLLLIRSHYRHPFGRFAGTLPGNVQLREAHGVMENHDVFW